MITTYKINAQDIIEAIDIVDYIAQYVDLEEQNGEYFGICPFHDDINPSFSVTPETQLWYCFGCHKGGNIIEFAKKYHNINFQEALLKLANYAGIDATNSAQPKHLASALVMKKYAPRKQKERLPTYHIMDSSIMDQYEPVGKYADIWRREGIGDEVMAKYQVRYDPFSNRLVFPIHNPEGKIINISGRTLDPQWKEKRLRKYNYYSSMGRLDTMFGLAENREAILSKKEIIIFEGAKSVFKADQWGFSNVAAALTSRINQYQMRLLIQLGCKVVLAFDSDVNVYRLDFLPTLKRFLRVEAITNKEKLLGEKMSPVDSTKEVWEYLYRNRVRL